MKNLILTIEFFLVALILVSVGIVFAAVVDTKPPVITLWNPSGTPSYTNQNFIVISGIVSDQGGSGVSYITVNGGVVYRGKLNAVTFSKWVSLSKGYNYFKVNAYDVAGNPSERKFTVIRL
jgi:hypothetical protein